jgi:methionyl-tRNA formyltransferase
LEAVTNRHDVVGVVTQPDRPAGRGHKLTPTPVKRAAEARGLRVLTPEKLKPFADEARALGAEAFVVASYGKIAPPALLDLVPIAFNVHPSLLPLYRGATPLQSAIRDGRTETGVTIIAMDAGMDTGDVLLQERASIGPEETYGELHDRLAKRGAELVVDALQRYEDGSIEPRSQNEIARELGISDEEIARTVTRPLRKEDLVIDWSLPRRRVIDLVRSLSPQPLARTDTADGEMLKILSVRPIPANDPTTGHPVLPPAPAPYVSLKRPAFEAQCGDGNPVAIECLIAPNRGPMTGEAYARSYLDRLIHEHAEK